MACFRIRNRYFMCYCIALQLDLSATHNLSGLHRQWLDCVRHNTFLGCGGAAPHDTTGHTMFDTFILDCVAGLMMIKPNEHSTR